MFLDAEHTQVTLNGHICEGFSDDADCIMVPDITIANVRTSADGKAMYSGTGDKGGEVTLKFHPNSRSFAWFMRQFARIKQGAVVEWSGSISNSDAGYSTRMENGRMMAGPAGNTVGKGDAANREFLFHFEVINPNYDAAKFTGIPRAAAAGTT